MRAVLVLHNVRSVYNVSSIFRSADAAGVERIILSGYTPAPLDRFGRPRQDFAKISLGAEKTVSWRAASSLAREFNALRAEGYQLLALEQSAGAYSLFHYSNAEVPFALILGNEVRGLSKQALARVDCILEIPMHGKKESLNVSVAAGIALFTLLQKR